MQFEPLADSLSRSIERSFAAYVAVTSRSSASLFGRNLTDKQTLDFGAQAPGLGAALLGYRSRGRQIGVRLGSNY